MKTRHKRAYRYRFCPTVEQQRILARTFGCVRFVYNHFLHLRKQSHFQEQKSLRYHQTSALLTQLKRLPDHAFLCEVSCVPTQQALRHLDRAFKNFFEGRAQYPVFKKKHQEQSAEYTRSAFTWDGTHLTLAKMEEPLASHGMQADDRDRHEGRRQPLLRLFPGGRGDCTTSRGEHDGRA